MKGIKVRFAPAPSGEIHLGNLRAALINFLYARHTKGELVLRIEDTDAATADQANVSKIIQTLKAYGIEHDHGPDKPGADAPYFQSDRTHIYLKFLNTFEENNLIYRCFCTKEDLESERELQVKLKQPPRYSRRCLGMSAEKALQKIEFGMPFVWRLRLNHEQVVTFNDVAKGIVSLKMSNFSDPAITRPDGSFTFIFANFVDDVTMKMSHVVRGEDHLSNTAVQVFMYNVLMYTPPIFAHLPIILNEHGQKLSKRERHFSAQSLLDDGFLPEVVCDHLVRMGNFSDAKPRLMGDLIREFLLESSCSSSNLRHDPKQLMWLAKEHMKVTTAARILQVINDNEALRLLLSKITFVDTKELLANIEILKDEFGTIVDLLNCLCGLKSDNEPDLTVVSEVCTSAQLETVAQFLVSFDQTKSFDNNFNEFAGFKNSESQCSKPVVMKTIRILCSGKAQGICIEKTIKIYGRHAHSRKEGLPLFLYGRTLGSDAGRASKK